MASSSSADQRDAWESHWSDFYDASQVNPAGGYRLRMLTRWLGKALRPTSRVLDIGSGAGDLVTAVSDLHPAVTVRGIELSSTGIAIARTRAPNAEFLQWNLLESSEAEVPWPAWADVAVCSEVLEHVDEPDRLLSNARRFLAPECRLLVTVPGGPMSAFDRHIGHRRHYSRPELRALLEAAGFTVERCDAVGFPFFNLYRLMILSRGRSLVRDAAAGRTTSGLAARVAGSVFNTLLGLNPPLRRGGWQMTAEARLLP